MVTAARLALITAVLAACPAAGRGDPAPPADPTRPAEGKPDLAGLIRQLGSDTFAGRDEASRKLEKAGGRALVGLRQALDSPDLEVRRRAKRLINRIELAVFREVRQFAGHTGSVNAVAFSPDGHRAASGDGVAVRLWDVASGKERAHCDAHRDRVMAVAFSPDGKYVASGSEDRQVLLLDAGKLTEVRRFREHRGDVRAVAFTPDGKRLVSADRAGAVFVWSVPDGKRLACLREAGPGPLLCAVPLDDRRLALAPGRGNDALVRKMDEKDPAVALLVGHAQPVSGLAVSRDGKRLLTASHDQTVVYWDVKAGKPMHTLRGHTAAACCVAVSACGTLAVSGGADKDLRLWDLARGTARAVRGLRGHTSTIWSVAVSPDGKFALSGSADGTMRLWTVSP